MARCRPRAVLSLGMASAALIVGAFVLQGAGCVADIETFTSASEKGGCDPAKDDKNPCTDYSCPEGIAKLTPVADGTACVFGPNSGVCSAGTCKLDCLVTDSCGCTNAASDCPPSTECISFTCEASKCKKTVNAGKELNAQIQGDCQTAVCGDDGEPTTKEANPDVPIAKEPICHQGVCAMGVPSEQPLDPGVPCNDGSGNVCDGEGKCVACLKNDKMDGQETGVDCGPTCPLRCDGDACTDPGTCESQICSNGVCCNSECSNACQACNLPGKIGVCTNVPAGDKGGCMGVGTEVCGTNGMCGGGASNGDGCTAPNQCASTACINGVCKQKAGPCAADAECASNKCMNNTCVP